MYTVLYNTLIFKMVVFLEGFTKSKENPENHWGFLQIVCDNASVVNA